MVLNPHDGYDDEGYEVLGTTSRGFVYPENSVWDGYAETEEDTAHVSPGVDSDPNNPYYYEQNFR